MRVCNKCNISKELSNINFNTTKNRNGNVYFRHTCINCQREFSRKHSKQNVNSKENMDRFLLNNPNYRENWRKKNQIHIREYNKKYESRLHIKLKKRISDAIRKSLKNKGLKKNLSISELLDYNKNDLKAHLEKQFEPWMTWDNWGIYNTNTWDDNDQSTWTWQIDHIIPVANFSYESEQDPAFKEMWKLDNLRPYSAKNNIIDGAKRNRIIAIHNKT